MGINTPYGDIRDEDRAWLSSMSNGDIALMHHGPHIINEDSRSFIKKLAEREEGRRRKKEQRAKQKELRMKEKEQCVQENELQMLEREQRAQENELQMLEKEQQNHCFIFFTMCLYEICVVISTP